MGNSNQKASLLFRAFQPWVICTIGMLFYCYNYFLRVSPSVMQNENYMLDCPCGSKKLYSDCCANYIEGKSHPPSPEALMRSRYTAYTFGNIDYIEKTMKSPANSGFNKEDAKAWANKVKWESLKVIRSYEKNNKYFVEFIAKFSLENQSQYLHEISEFLLENGQWFYINGKTPKLGRNDPCICKSQKKYKNCCGRNKK